MDQGIFSSILWSIIAGKQILKAGQKIVMDPFCLRQFERKTTSGFIDFDKDKFTEKIDSFYKDQLDKGGLKDGYAPFCKHLFIPNFTEAPSSIIKITD